MMMPNVSSLVDRFGFQMNVIKSGAFKDSGSPFRQFEEKDRALIQSLVDTAFEQFLRAISKARNLEVEKVREFADGRIILGRAGCGAGFG